MSQAQDSHSDGIPGIATGDVKAYGKALQTHAKRSAWGLALDLLQQLATDSIVANVVIYNTGISACGRGRRWTSATRFLEHMIKMEVLPDLISLNSCLTACDGPQWRQALPLFNGMVTGQLQLPRDPISYSGVLRACAHSQYWVKAVVLLREMCEDSILPDVICYGSALSAAERAGQWPFALALLEGMKRADVNVICFNAAISSCEKAAEWPAALALLLGCC